VRHEYTPRGVCAGKIEFTVNNGTVADVKIVGGCPGNGAAVAKLVEGMKSEEVIARLENVRCGGKPSSCPAELAKALKAVK
jgi:uncharacterized protein (TIGR03905 family)